MRNSMTIIHLSAEPVERDLVYVTDYRVKDGIHPEYKEAGNIRVGSMGTRND